MATHDSSDIGGTQIDPLSDPFASLDDLSPDLSSLQDLATRGAWRSILDKVARARSVNLLQQPHHHLTYLSFNVLALSKLRRFADANSELESLQELDSSDYRYESYPKIYPNRSGSMVPFFLRWLQCVIPLKMGQRREGLDQLYLLLNFVRTKLKEKEELVPSQESLNAWKRREVLVSNTIIGDHVIHKEFGVSLDLIRDMLSRDCLGLDAVLLSKLGYIQLQIGDLEGAKTSFGKVEGMDNEGNIELKNLVNRNKALVYMVGKDYVSAVREYEECIERDPMDVVAINNKAICLMYLRDLSDSIKVLENSLERVPTVTLNETLVVNLCSMYELAYVNHSETKKTLSTWISRVAPDDFDASCTRI